MNTPQNIRARLFAQKLHANVLPRLDFYMVGLTVDKEKFYVVAITYTAGFFHTQALSNYATPSAVLETHNA